MRRLSAAIDRPVSYVLLQADDDPELWRKQLAASLEACAEGASCSPRSRGARPGILSGHHTTLCLFSDFPAYAALRERCTVGRPSWRRRWPTPRCGGRSCRGRPASPAQADAMDQGLRAHLHPRATRPTTSRAPSARWPAWRRRAAVTPLEVAYDEMARDGGQGLLYIPILNYATGDLDHVREMMLHPQGLLGLADGGAHTGTICDASMPTFMLTHWTRDRSRGERLPLEYVVQKQTRDTARLYGMSDRGTVEPGALADLNLIDYDALTLGAPYVTQRPAGGRPPAAPEGVGLRGHHQGGDRHLRARRADRRAAGPPGARRPLSPAGSGRHSPPQPVNPRSTGSRGTADCTPYGGAPDPVRRSRDGVHIGYQVWGRSSPESTGRAGGRARVQQRAHDLHRRDGRRAQLAPLHRAGGGVLPADPLRRRRARALRSPADGHRSLHRGLGPRRAGRHGRRRLRPRRRAGARRAAPWRRCGWPPPTPNGCISLVIVNGTARVGRAEDYGFGVSDEEVAAAVRHRRPLAEDGIPRDIAIFAPSLAHRVGFREWWGRAARRGASPATALAFNIVTFSADMRWCLPVHHLPDPRLRAHATATRT